MLCLRRRPEFVMLALVALAAQMLLSLGHSHSRQSINRTVALQCRTFFPPVADLPCPSHNNDRHDDGKGCAICWSISVASSAVLDAPLKIAVPAFGTIGQLPPPQTLVLARSSPAAFQPRGPPVPVLA